MSNSQSLTIQQMTDALARAGDAVFLWKHDGDRLEWLNKGSLDRTLGFLTDCTTGDALAGRYGEDHERRRSQWLSRSRALTGFSATHRVEDKNSDFWIEERLVRIDGPGEPAACIGFLRNVSEEQVYRERLTYLACFDELTGHFTRARLRTALAQSLVSSFAANRSFCFALIGLDNMAGALTVAKQSAPGGFAFHEPDDTEAEKRRYNIAMADELSAALRDGRIRLAFQPIVSAGDTDTVIFHECLARMVDRTGELVPAARFMPVAEHLGFVRLIDQRVLELAFEVLVAIPGLKLSVNLSPQTMNDIGWLDTFERLTAAHPDETSRLIIEITESYAIHDSKRAAEQIGMFHARGCSVALDDFGAGYTSFKYFKTLNLDIVKIDGSFIRGVCDSPDNQLFVDSLSRLARHYDMTVVAEMVEHGEAADLLREYGVDCFQGNFFGPAEVVEASVLKRQA